MLKIKNVVKKSWMYIAAVILPWLIIFLYAAYVNVWPLGSYTLIKGDTSLQLVPFAYEIWNKVHSGDSFDFTWNLLGGIDFGAAKGYFYSPFTLLILITPKCYITDMIQFIMVTKWVFSGVSMVYFFNHTRHNTLTVHKRLVSFFLGMAYMMGNSAFNNMRYIQFGDVMICFPILLLLTEKMATDGKWKLYYILLTFAMFSNSYMAYELCIFLIIWFLMQMDDRTKCKWKRFVLFAGVSVLAAITNVYFLISGLGLAQSRLDNTDTEYRLQYAKSILLTLTDFFKQFFFMSEIGEPSSIEPNIYLSVVMIVLLPFLCFVHIGKRKKIGYILSIVAMTLSFFVGFLSLIWHLLQVPNGVYHRFSNYYCFLLLFMLLIVLEHLQEIRFWQIVCVGVALIGGFIYLFTHIDDYTYFITYWITILLIILYLIILVLFKKESLQYKNVLMTFVLIGVMELSVNMFVNLSTYVSANYSKTSDNFAEDAVEVADNVDMDLGERISSASYLTNIGMLINKPSFSGFVSTINSNMQTFFDRMGMGENGRVEYTVKGASPLLNLLFNVRYSICTSPVEVSDAECVTKKNDVYLYRMNRLAGLGYMVSDDILSWDVFDTSCFDVQNSFVKLSVGGDKIFYDKQPDVTCIDINGNEIEADEEYKKNYGSYMFNCKSRYGNENDSVQASFIVDEDMDLYVFSYSQFNASISIFVDGELVSSDSYSSFVQGTYHVGNVKKGQKIELVAVSYEDFEKDVDMMWFLRFAAFDDDAYEKAYEKLSARVYDINTMESNDIKGTIVADEDGLMMTSVQALDGFSVYVDGKKTDYETIANALIAVPLTKGEHTVEFKYISPGNVWSKYVSIAGLMIYVILCIVEQARTKRKQLKTNEE